MQKHKLLKWSTGTDYRVLNDISLRIILVVSSHLPVKGSSQFHHPSFGVDSEVRRFRITDDPKLQRIMFWVISGQCDRTPWKSGGPRSGTWNGLVSWKTSVLNVVISDTTRIKICRPAANEFEELKNSGRLMNSRLWLGPGSPLDTRLTSISFANNLWPLH